MSLTLIFAVLLDTLLGEPKKHHPLVVFGAIANATENKLRRNDQTALSQKINGIFALLIIIPLPVLVYQFKQWPTLNLLISPLILYFCIANNSLKHHALLVFHALQLNDLQQARDQVGMIVSRETANMNALEVRKATIESVLENGADAVFAPIFWFIVAGPAAALMYRLSNTLDAMWGYKNQRYRHFGWAAARFDDALNWLPARLTALSYALLGNTKSAFFCWKNQASHLDSPNAGPVMSSGAGSLDLRLGGPAYYHGTLKYKIFFGAANNPDNGDIKRANALIDNTLLLWLLIIIVVDYSYYFFV